MSMDVVIGDTPGAQTGSKETPRMLHRTESAVGWFRTAWFQGGLAGLLVLIIAVSLAARADFQFLCGELALTLSFYLSLFLLSDRPLIDPVQAGALAFYWWFGVGPVVISGFSLLIGATANAVAVQEAGMQSLWIVAIGLPLYALASRTIMAWLRAKRLYARFLMPRGRLFKPRTLLLYWLVGTIATLAVRALSVAGVQGIIAVNYLGGTRTDIWWVGVLNAVGGVTGFAVAAIMVSLSTAWKSSPRWLRALGLVIVVQTLVGALTSGWKSSFVYLLAYIIVARTSRIQRVPWGMILVGALGFLLIVEPFVTSSRQVAALAGAATRQDAKPFSWTGFSRERCNRAPICKTSRLPACSAAFIPWQET